MFIAYFAYIDECTHCHLCFQKSLISILNTKLFQAYYMSAQSTQQDQHKRHIYCSQNVNTVDIS